MNRKITFLGIAVALSTGSSFADTPWYASVQAGATFVDNAKWRDDEPTDLISQINGPFTQEADFDSGFNAGFSFGKYLHENFRLEGELSFKRNEIDRYTVTNDPGVIQVNGQPLVGLLNGFEFPIDGELKSASFLINGFFEYEVRPHLKPYVGGGVGVVGMWLDADDRTATGNPLSHDSDVAFAWQLGAGVGYDFTPALTAGLDYRYFTAEDAAFLEALADDRPASHDYQTHNWSLSLRYKF